MSQFQYVAFEVVYLLCRYIFSDLLSDEFWIVEELLDLTDSFFPEWFEGLERGKELMFST